MARRRPKTLAELVQSVAEDMLVDVVGHVMREMRRRTERAVVQGRRRQKVLNRGIAAGDLCADYEAQRLAELKRKVSN